MIYLKDLKENKRFMYIKDQQWPKYPEGGGDVGGSQLSEYVQVVCRNTNGTCLKSVSKTPTFFFFWDIQLFEHPAKLAKFRSNLGQFCPNRAIFEISTKK